ncbi:unnamed protein product [Closterium sp. NIES-65]|nr:unnamed protein product [Closterium sp. NIES-65]
MEPNPIHYHNGFNVGCAATARARGARALAGAAVVAVGAAEGVGVGASVAAVEVEAAAAAAVGVEAAEAAAKVELVGLELCSGETLVVVGASSTSALVRPRRPSSFVSGTLRASGLGVLVPVLTSCVWATALGSRASGVAIFDLDYDAILAAMYVVSTSAEGNCYLCVPPDLGMEAAALGASESAAPGASESAAPCASESTAPVLRLYLPSFSTNLVNGADLHDRGVAASGQVFAAASKSGRESAPGSYRLLSHQTLLWHHCLCHPSLPCLRGMASHVVVSGLPRSLPPLPPGPAPTCVPCVEGRQRAAPHSSELPPTEAPLQTPYGCVGPSPRSGGEFSSNLLRAFSRAEGIRQTLTLPASPQQNGIAERRIGMVLDVARTSMIHAAAPHFLWPFAVQYAANQINLQLRVSLPESSPTLRWTGKVGDASAFRVWGSRAFVLDLSANKLFSRAVPCVLLGFPLDAPGWQFYHPTSRRVLSSQDVTFDESVPKYRVSQVDAVEPVEVAVDSGAARGAEPAAWRSFGCLVPAGATLSAAAVRVVARRWSRAAGAGGAANAGGSIAAGGAGATGLGGAGTGRTGAAGPGGATGAGPAGVAGASGAAGIGAPGGTGAGAAASSRGPARAGAAGGAGAGGAAGAGAPVGAGVGTSGAAGGAAGVGGATGVGANVGGTGAVPARSGV